MPKRFSASSAAQLMACPGSANLELAIPGYVDPSRDDMAGAKGIGTLMHKSMDRFAYMMSHELFEYSEALRELAKIHWRKRRPMMLNAVAMEKFINVEAPTMDATTQAEFIALVPELVELPPKMLKYIADCAEYLSLKFDYHEVHGVPDSAYKAEEPLVANWLPSKGKTTPDITIVTRALLEVYDYKTGVIEVSPVENDQLMFYAACKLHLAPEATEFTLHVLQPGNLESWAAPISVLHEWMSRAIEADRRITRNDLTLHPSDHCTFCPANPHARGDKADVKCPAQMEMLYPSVVDEAEILGL